MRIQPIPSCALTGTRMYACEHAATCQLSELRLHDNKIGDAGTAALASALHSNTRCVWHTACALMCACAQALYARVCPCALKCARACVDTPRHVVRHDSRREPDQSTNMRANT